MIYLIESSAFKRKEDGTIEYFQLLKIGYTDDSNRNIRYSQYKMHNPTCEIIHEIPEGNMDQESRLHYKFKDLRFEDYGDEWYVYNEEIINYIKTVALEELDKLPNNPVRGDRKVLNGKRKAKKIISYLFDTKEEINNYLSTLSDKLGDTISYTTALDYISQDSTIDQDKLKNYYEIKRRSDTGIYIEDKELNLEVSNFLRIYESKTTMYDKLKLLCEYDLSNTAKEIILAQIPDSDEIKSYYLALGPQRLHELGYGITKIKKELSIVTFSQEILLNTIYSNFNVGDKILFTDLKEKLSNLYASINYNVNAKATDIFNYFEAKEYMTSIEIDGKKKRVRGYKLLSSYEQSFWDKLKEMKKLD